MAQVFIKELLTADNNPSLLASVKSDDKLQNGMVVALGDREDLSTYKVGKVADVGADSLYIVNAPVIIEIEGIGRVEGLNDPTMFEIPAKRPARAFKPMRGDTFFLSTTGITGSPTVGEYAVPVVGAYTFGASGTIPADIGLALKIESAKTVRVGSGSNLKSVTGFMVRVVTALN